MPLPIPREPPVINACLLLLLVMARTLAQNCALSYGSVPFQVTWRPVTSIPLAETDGNPNTAADPDWLPLVNTPSHPEYPAGHPSQNGAAAAVLLSHFRPRQTFTLTTAGQPSRTYNSILQARSDGNQARVWGGMHYPSTVEISDAAGEAIANYVNRNSMQPLHHGHHSNHPHRRE
jgi:membrane-associated phospholipid phosphatase